MKPIILSGALLIGLAGFNTGQVRAQSTGGQGTGFQDLQTLESKQVRLPNGWSITPAGRHVTVGDLPLNIAVSRSQRFLAVTNNGQSTQSIQLVDAKNEKILDNKIIGKSWGGIAFSKNEKYLYASGGND